jgi:hypothetical protein
VDKRRHAVTQSPFEIEDACGGGREGDEANRGGGPAKGEDNRHRSWSSPLRTLTSIDSPEGQPVVKRGSPICTHQCKEAYLRVCRSRLDNRLETIDVTSSCKLPRSYAVLMRDRRLGIRRSSEQWPELQEPPSHRFLGHVGPTLSEQIFRHLTRLTVTHYRCRDRGGGRNQTLASASLWGMAYRMCKRYYWSARRRSQHCSGDASPGSECSEVIGLGGDAWGIQ